MIKKEARLKSKTKDKTNNSELNIQVDKMFSKTC